MSSGPGRAEGLAPARPRPRILGELETERQHALNAFEHGRVREIDEQIARLSAGTAANPSKETTGRPAARKQRTR